MGVTDSDTWFSQFSVYSWFNTLFSLIWQHETIWNNPIIQTKRHYYLDASQVVPLEHKPIRKSNIYKPGHTKDEQIIMRMDWTRVVNCPLTLIQETKAVKRWIRKVNSMASRKSAPYKLSTTVTSPNKDESSGNRSLFQYVATCDQCICPK